MEKVGVKTKGLETNAIPRWFRQQEDTAVVSSQTVRIQLNSHEILPSAWQTSIKMLQLRLTAPQEAKSEAQSMATLPREPNNTIPSTIHAHHH